MEMALYCVSIGFNFMIIDQKHQNFYSLAVYPYSSSSSVSASISSFVLFTFPALAR